jgi:PAS domain S-box-containing protein
MIKAELINLIESKQPKLSPADVQAAVDDVLTFMGVVDSEQDDNNEIAIIAEADDQCVITSVNELFCEISGYSKEELIGTMFGIENNDKQSSAFYKAVWLAIQRGRIWRGEICNRHKNGDLYWISTVIVPTSDCETNKIKLIILSFTR